MGKLILDLDAASTSPPDDDKKLRQYSLPEKKRLLLTKIALPESTKS